MAVSLGRNGASERQTVTADAVRIAYRRFVPQTATSGFPTVVCLHGLFGTRDIFRPYFEDLERLGIPYVAPDFRGFGGSENKGVGLDGFVRDLRAILEAEGLGDGRTPLFFFGYSMGCAAAERYLRSYPIERAKRFYVSPSWSFRGRFAARHAGFFFAGHACDLGMLRRPAVLAKLVWETLRASFPFSAPGRTTVIFGDRDICLPRDAVPSKRKIRILRDADHYLFFRRTPEVRDMLVTEVLKKSGGKEKPRFAFPSVIRP